MIATLIVLDGEQEQRHDLVEENVTIGRDATCEICLVVGTVSRFHARILSEDSHFFLEELSARNGTFLNGQRVAANTRTPLRHRDRIQLGTVEMWFECNLDTDLTPEDDSKMPRLFRVSVAEDEEGDGPNIVGVINRTDVMSSLNVCPERKLKSLLNISQSLANVSDLKEFLPNLLDTLLDFIFPHADRGFILLRREEDGEMIPAAQRYRNRQEGSAVRISRTVLNKVLADKQGVISVDAAEAPPPLDTQDDPTLSVSDLAIRSVMCAPMIVGTASEPIGVIQIDTINPIYQFKTEDMDLLMAVAAQAALSYQSADQLVTHERVRSEMEIERHRSLSQMVVGMAHEINTPLGIVNTAASAISELVRDDALVESTSKDEDAADAFNDLSEAAELIQGNIDRANRLVEQFKGLSVRQVTEVRETVDLIEYVEEVVGLFRIQAKRSALEVVIQNRISDRAQAQWDGYPGYLSQILLNLLTNVQRYAYPDANGGTVELEVSAADLSGDPAFCIAVRDFGAGISDEDQAQIFNPFFTTGRTKEATGLGLSIVFNLINDSLKGTIRVESTVGTGTTFILTFPKDVPELATDI